MKLQIVDLNKLKTLYWLYYERSLLKASRKLNFTPSAVRQSIKNLEKDLGIQLFTISGKSYIPTKEAHEYLSIVSPFFDRLEEKLSLLSDQRKSLSGKLVIGSPFVYSYEKLTILANQFVKKYPGVDIQIVSVGTTYLLDKVINNKFDFAVAYDGPEVIKNSKLSFKEISEDSLVLCYNPQFIKLGSAIQKISDFIHCPHIAYTSNHFMLERWYKYHFSKFPNLKIKLSINNVPGVRQSVLDGAGLGVLPYSYVEKDLRAKTLKIIKTKKKALINKRILIQNADKVPSMLEKTFVQFLTSK